jgi:hypothetical protein
MLSLLAEMRRGLDQRRALTPMELATGRATKVLNLRNSVTLDIATGQHSFPKARSRPL